MTTASRITASTIELTGVIGDGLSIGTAREIRWVGEVVRDGQAEVIRCAHRLPGLGPAIPAFPHTTEADAIECARLVATARGIKIGDDAA